MSVLAALAISLVAMPCHAQFDEVDGPDRMRGYYLGDDGLELDFDDVYWRALKPEASHLWLAFGWQVAALGFGTAWYWSNAEFNAADWDYPGLEARLNLSAVRFDDNHFTINHVSHPFDGAAYYVLARSSGLGIAGASGLAMLTSAVWEFGLEWRELVSLNDQIFTPIGGVAIGEGIFRLGHYLNSAPFGGRWPHKLAAMTLGFPVWLHRRIDGRRIGEGPTDDLGFSAAYHHRFRLAYARVIIDDGVTRRDSLDGFDARMDLYAVPGLGRPGTFDVFFSEGNLIDVDVDATWDDDGEGGEWGIRFDSVLFGWLDQDIEGVEGDPESRWGQTAWAGLAVGYEHRQRWRPEPRDRWAMIHLPGPDAGLWSWLGPVSARLRLAIHPTFDAIDSVAAPRWIEENPDLTIRSVLARRGYYFGFGLSTRLDVDLVWRDLRVSGRARFAHVDSTDGLDRFQERIEYDGPVEDDLVQIDARVEWSIPAWLVTFGAAYTHTDRWGRMGDVRAERSWDRFELSTGIQF